MIGDVVTLKFERFAASYTGELIIRLSERESEDQLNRQPTAVERAAR